jgi:Cu2+-exporting ATPase
MDARPLGYVQLNSSNFLAKSAMFQPQPASVGLGAWRICRVSLARVIQLGKCAAGRLPRPDLKDMMAALAKRGVAVEMLTGDARGPVAEIAWAAGITTWKSHVDPKLKAAHLEGLRRGGHHVLMVGDGLNDAGALALADVSMAPGTAADVSQLAADFVLRGDSLMGVVESLDVARKTRSLVNQNFAFAAIYNVAAIPLAMMGLVSPAFGRLHDGRLFAGGDDQRPAPRGKQSQMSEIAPIIGAALAIGLGALLLLLWSLSSGQYDDLDGAAERILIEDENDFV